MREWSGVVAPVRLVPLLTRPLRVRSLHSYYGTIELKAASDGIAVVDLLSLERYLLGLNEVPTDWPMEALRAQAVAARTYSLWTLAHEPGGAAALYGFDICASDECQVFSGADVLRAETGPRWARAVRSTGGRAVLFDGRPILARYHSTSGGSTLNNSEVFEGSPDLPYLRSVSSPLEDASPFFRWTVSFPLDDLQRALAVSGLWARSRGRLTEVRTVESGTGLPYPDVELVGPRASSVVSAEELRAALRTNAPRLWPNRYPSQSRDGSVRLPETLPSNRIAIETAGDVAEVAGRGWGHGVGMSQWGAQGMALEGAGYEAILEHYYTGTEVDVWPSGGRVEVGVDWARPSLGVFGAFRLVDGLGRVLVAEAYGTWEFEWSGEGVVDVRSPPGFGASPEVELRRAPDRVMAGAAVPLRISLAGPARVTATASGPGRGRSATVVRDSGAGRMRWRAPARPGRYRLVVRAANGSGSARSEPRVVTVVSPPRPSSESAGRSLWSAIAVAIAGVVLLALVAVGAVSFASTIRK